MKQGKMYKNIVGVIVMCTNNLSDNVFCGVVIKTNNEKFKVGELHNCLSTYAFDEVIGQVDLNNVFIQD